MYCRFSPKISVLTTTFTQTTHKLPSHMTMRPNAAGSLAYVRGNGRITRQSLNVARFSFRRLVCVLGILAVLILTNPANGTHGLFPMSWWPKTTIGMTKGKSPKSKTSTWLKFWLPSERTTNYGIFALQNYNRDATVRITGLLHSTILCHLNSENELTDAFCNAIGKSRQQQTNVMC